jgi:predicted exporter/SAM-dependent methyltransferase
MINYRLLAAVTLLIFVFAALGLLRLDIDTDVVRSLPSGEKVITDALDVFEHHPVHDQIAVDVMIGGDDPDTLVEIGALLEKKMEDSGLFAQVGIDDIGELIPELAFHAARNLPLLFSQKELEQKVAPLLDTDLIHKRLLKLYQELSSMEGIGQAGFLDLDPLGLKDLVLAKMAPLAPSLNSRFYQGNLLSADGRHLLVTARPLAAGTDTTSARKISELLTESSRDLQAKYSPSGQEVTLTPVGGYRAALDNERIIRHDVQLALLLATVGIGLLLLFAFPRPLIGLLSLVPALAGTGAALFVYSLYNSSISVMVLGFGGAIISITVDHGIAYLLFLDRNHESKGKEASHEVYSIGIMAVITSIGAFLILSSSGFLIFAELGQFTALGILFAFLFVHSVFPKIFPDVPPAGGRVLPLRGLTSALYKTGKPGAIAAALLACGLLFFAKPQFYVSLSSMNTVSDSTLAADELFTKVWGSIGERVLLMNSADTIAGIQMNNDRLLAKIEQDIQNEVLTAAFLPSMIFPGRERAEQNLASWRSFWNADRRGQLKEDLREAGSELGFTPDAFTNFFSLLDSSFAESPQRISTPIPAKYFSLLGISEDETDSGLIQFITVLPGKNYDGADFLSRYGDAGRIFDATFFTKRLADILFSTFTKMLAIIAVSVIVLLFFFYLNLPLTLLTLLPPFFAYICTLGTLKIIGHPLDIPALMLSVVILGMGVDYSIFCVRAHQRYRDIDHPSYVLVRVAVFIAGTSTLIGFGVLALAEHSLLKSIGITSLLGIGYSLLGTYLLLPPLLNMYMARENKKIDLSSGKSNSIRTRVRARYRTLEPYPRMFARFKLQFDPMFNDLPRMLAEREDIKTIIDIGCGFGVPACWCLEQYRDARVYGIDPDPERVRVAGFALGDRGAVTVGWAPETPAVPRPADAILLLDMLHYLEDETAAAVLNRSFQALGNKGLLVTRFVLRPAARPSWSWRLEDVRVRLSGGRAWYRSSERMTGLMKEAGFAIIVGEVSAVNPELVWMVGRADKETADAGQYA